MEHIKIIYKHDPSKIYRVILQNYKVIESDHSAFNNKQYKIILGIVPDGTDINIHGLYDKFVVSGFLVYKIFDYDIQVGELGNMTNRNAGEYTFIGDIMDQFFPFV